MMRSARTAAALMTIIAVLVTVGSSLARAVPRIESFEASTVSTDAGAHSDARTSFLLSGGKANNIIIKLPAGFLGNPQATPQCPYALFQLPEGGPLCPGDTQIGEGTATNFGGVGKFPQRVYNLVSGPGTPARFGISTRGGTFNVPVYVAQTVTVAAHAADNYAVTLSVPNIDSTLFIVSDTLTLWGVPADHNGSAASEGRAALIDNPTDCTAVPVTTFSLDTVEEVGIFLSASAASPRPTNCQLVPFGASISLEPDTTQAGAPTGPLVDLEVPQNENPDYRRTSDLKQAVVTLPQGLVISPSAASAGLQACTDGQFGAGLDPPARCPLASQIGTTEVKSPVLRGVLKGNVYLGAPLSTDPTSGRMFRVFQELKGFGLDVKLTGSVTADPVTGQLTATFSDLPEVPFSDFKLHFKEGPNAVLANPTTCGPNTTTTRLTPYNGNPPITPSSTYTTTLDGHNAPCPTTPPFTLSSSISTTTSQAGALTPLSVSFTRQENTQPLGQINAHLPPGLLGNVSAVALCDPANAAAGTCPAASRVGVVNTTAGAGPDPLSVPGTAYLARGTNGYPFALSVLVPAIAGPYSLGNVVVLVNLKVNNDGSLTATTGPLPHIIDGIPLNIRAINLTTDPGFTFNPTSCAPLQMTGQATSLGGSSTPLNAPFQATGCQTLPFKPGFVVVTSARASRANGASLEVRVTQTPGQANIHKVAVALPKQLPSRLTTIQHACPEATFNANPAGCEPRSIIGTGTAITPALTQPLKGPAYLVSHGGVAFPNIEILLQGEGITVDLTGNIDIKGQITSSTFNTVPDVPITAFDLTLPTGPHSALTANGNLCTTPLLMPTTIEGQNNTTTKQTTHIHVTDCPKHKHKKTRHKKANKASHRHNKHKRSNQ